MWGKLQKSIWYGALLLLAAIGQAQAQNLAVNPSFEQRNQGFETQYKYVATGTTGNGAGSYTVRADESTYNTGFGKYNDHTSSDGTGLYLIVDGSTTGVSVAGVNVGTQYFWRQSFTGLLANTTYTFSFWELNSNSGSLPTIQVSYSLDGGSNYNNAGTFTNNNTAGLWQQNTVTFNTGNLAANTQVYIRLIDTNTIGGSNDFGIDDIALLAPAAATPPTASNITNSPALANNSGATALTPGPLGTASGSGNSIRTYTVFAASTGTLYYNNTAVTGTAGVTFAAANLSKLTYQPAAGSTTTATFSYTVTDANNLGSDPGTYSIPVRQAIADVTTTLSGPQQLGAGAASGSYTAVFTNNGPDVANQVTQVVTLPLGATMTAAQIAASGGTYTAGNATTAAKLAFPTSASLASGNGNTYTFAITAPSTTGTTYSMTSTVGTATSEGANNASDTSSLAITVTPANRFTTYGDNNSLAANTVVNASVILNDENPDATTSFTATVVTSPTNGAVTLNADGSYTYTPNPNYIGTDFFTYQICQTGTTPTCSNTSTVKLNIYDPSLVCTSGTGPNLLLNPSFTNGNVNFTSSYAYVDQAAGALVPEGKYGVGSDASQYHGSFKGTGRTGTGDKFMIVNGAANIQRVYSQTVAVQPNRYYTFSVYATSVNPGSPAKLGFVINGESTSVVTTLDGTTNYVKLSDVWFSGNSTSANFEIRDVNRDPGGNDFGLDDVYFGTCTKNLLVASVTAPALSKTAATTALPALSGTASGGPTLASFTIQSLPNAASGTLYLNGTAVTVGQVIDPADADKLSFDPLAGYTGSQATFTYTATDSNGAGSDNRATFNIPLDTPLIAVDDVTSTPLNTAVVVAVTDNDRLGANGSPINKTTIDLQPGTAGVQQGTAANPIAVVGGTAYVNSAGQVVFTPSAGFAGTAFIPYAVQDNSGILSNQATLIVRVVSQLDLATSISSPANASTVTAGQLVTIAGTTANNSPAGTAANAVQQLQLPANLPGTPTYTRDGASVAASYDPATGLVVFPTLTGFAAGSTSAFGVTFVAPATGPLTATASVNNGSPDVNLVNNVASVTLAVTPQFDLATTLTGPATVVTSNLATYTVTTTNKGPSPVVGAVQTVQLPTNLAGVFATNGGTYDSGSGLVTFPALNLGNRQTQTNSVSFSPAASFSPQAAVTPNTNGAGDPITGNNTAYLNGAAGSTQVAVGNAATSAQSNPYVTVTGPAQVAPAALATYTVTQGNSGPAAAKGVQTTVSLLAGLAASSFTVNNVAGTLSNGVITFGTGGPAYTVATGLLALPALTADQGSAATPQTYSISFPAPLIGPSMAVTASVSTTSADPVPANNVATTETEIQPVADVATSISRLEGGTAATGSSLTAGQLVSYSVQTVNNSLNPALNVLQTVALPAGLPVASLVLNGLIGTLNNGVITFGGGATYTVASGLLALPTLSTLAGGAIQTNTVSFTVPDGTTALQTVANVSSPTTDNTLANNTASVSNSLTALQDLSLTLAGPAQAVQGNAVLYTVAATNNGTSAVGQQTTTLQLPTGLAAANFLVNNVAGTLSNGVITFGTGGPAYTVATGLLTMPATAIGRPGTSTLTTVQFPTPATIAQLDIAGSVAAASNESNLANNAALLSTSVLKSSLSNADLSTSIATNPTATSQAAGTAVTYTVTTKNEAGAAATNVAQNVVLPVGLTAAALRVNNTAGTFNRSAGTITYASQAGDIVYTVATGALTFPTVASLAVGSTAVNTVSLPLPATGPVVVVATSGSDNPDATPTNNTKLSSIAVTSAATATIGVSGPATTTPGTTVSYTVAATNTGPAAATNLGVTVTLPTGVSSYSLNGGPATAGSGTITIYGGTGTTVAAGQSVSNVISFAAPATSSFTVGGTVSLSNSPSGAASSTASATTTQRNALPIANDVANAQQTPMGNTGTALPLTALSATDADNGLQNYTVLSLPPSTQGTLKLSGTSVAANQSIATADVGKLTFTPASGFVGNAFFTYLATDNAGASSAPATYTIPVAQDQSSAYQRFNGNKGIASNPYANNDILAQVLDPNTATYTSGGGMFDATTGALLSGAANGLPTTGTNAVLAAGSTLPAGVKLDAATGRIYVENASQLVNNRSAQSYTVSVTTTDLNGGTNTVPVTFLIGASPLPVELVAFTAAARNRTVQLDWTTASEVNSAWFEVERSLDGVAFTKVGQLAAAGHSAAARTYRLLDAQLPAGTTHFYYRLRQVDQDNSATYSPVRNVVVAGLALGLQVFPNPAPAATATALTGAEPGAAVTVLDALGRVVLTATADATGAATLELPAGLAPGVYPVRAGQQTTRLVVR